MFILLFSIIFETHHNTTVLINERPRREYNFEILIIICLISFIYIQIRYQYA